MKLKDVVPHEFFNEYMDTPTAKLLEKKVLKIFDGTKIGWPGIHKNVYTFWLLETRQLVGWNESPSRGWGFPIYSLKNKKVMRDYFNGVKNEEID